MEAITVAVIGLIGSVLVVMIEKGRRENKKDHGNVMDHLEKIEDSIDDLDQSLNIIDLKLDNHLRDHEYNLMDMRFKTGEYVFSEKEKKGKNNGSKKR